MMVGHHLTRIFRWTRIRVRNPRRSPQRSEVWVVECLVDVAWLWYEPGEFLFCHKEGSRYVPSRYINNHRQNITGTFHQGSCGTRSERISTTVHIRKKRWNSQILDMESKICPCLKKSPGLMYSPCLIRKKHPGLHKSPCLRNCPCLIPQLPKILSGEVPARSQQCLSVNWTPSQTLNSRVYPCMSPVLCGSYQL